MLENRSPWYWVSVGSWVVVGAKLVSSMCRFLIAASIVIVE